jgi:hypothetical protein
MRTPQWIKKLGGHAGELFVCAELSKRGIPNALLPENFPRELCVGALRKQNKNPLNPERQALGLEVPDKLLATADEVIE